MEICNNYLKILVFNSNNEIINGAYFDIKHTDLLTKEEINREQDLLDKNIKIKKLSINEDGIVGYWN